MKESCLIILGLLLGSNLVFSQCPVEVTFSYDSLEFDHSYYDASSNSIFAVGFYESSITINGVDYFPTDTSNVGKVIVNLDTLGNVINSWQSTQPQNIVGGSAGSPGYFSPGLVVTDNSVFIPYTYYNNQLNSYIYSLEKYDKGGQPIWTYEIGSSVATAPRMGFDAIDIDSNGDIILTGVVQDTLVNNSTGDTFGSPNQTNAFVMAVDTINLRVNWFLPIQSSNNMELMGLTTDNSGGIYVSGNSLGAESITIDNNTTNYTGLGSGFIFKINVIDSDAGLLSQPWIKIFESSAEVEITALKYDFVHDFLHYASVDYSGGTDDTIVDTKIGAFNNGDGSIAWEHDMIIEGWYYLAYSSWFSPNGDAVYYSAWAKSGGQDFTRLKMDGTIIQDTLSSVATIQKFNTTTGNSELVTPTLYSFIGHAAVLPSGNVYAQANYSGSIATDVSIGKLNPSAYPFPFGLMVNSGGTTVGSASFEAFTTQTNATLIYQWFLDGDTVAAGGTSKTYIPTAPGLYRVDIADENGCAFTTRPKRVFEAGGNSVSDSLALVDLYRATNPGDTTWLNADFWLSGALDQWQGVTLDASRRVISLDLFSNNLTGEIPNSIGNLIFLENLNLGSNNLTGGIPTTFGELESLRNLFLEENPLGGVIPIDFNTLPNLERLQLRNSQLTGAFPESIMSCTQLIELSVDNNNLSGTVPSLSSLANLQIFAIGGNPELFYEIPANISDYTNLTIFSIYNTVPNGGEFPIGFYQLTNLRGLDLSEQQFTGSLSADIQNLVNLESLYLRNRMSGSLPQELANLTNLRTLDLSYNNFNSLPADLINLSNLIELFLVNNSFQIAELLPFASKGLERFTYANQRRIGENVTLNPAIGTNLTLNSSIADVAGIEYQWIFNNDTLSAANAATYTINSFTPVKAGAYYLQARHPNLPELIAYSGFINVLANSSVNRWYVDNDPTHTADFRSLYQAVSATKAGDTIYVAGSDQAYDGFYLFSPRILIGPGYFLEENPGGQFMKKSAKVNGTLSIGRTIGNGGNANSSGSKLYGLELNKLFIQPQLNQVDTLSDVHLEGIKCDTVLLIGSTRNLNVENSFINNLEILGAEFNNFSVGAYRENNSWTNNIIKMISPFSTSFNFSNALTNSDQVVWLNNTIEIIQSGIENFNFENCLVNVDLSSGNTFPGSLITNFSGVLQNNSGNFTIDNDYKPIGTLTTGAFGGTTPYILSGLPPIPAIYDVVVGPTLSLQVAAKNQDAVAITSLKYLYRKDNLNSNSFSVNGFTSSQDITVEFLPNRSALTANQSYEVVVVAIDANGKRSHRTYVPYEAIAANLSGTVVDIEGVNVNTGDVKLFVVNPFANKYDTAAIKQLSGSNTFNFENLILGDYIILANPKKSDYPDLIPTYLGNTIDWELASTLSLVQNISDVKIEVEKRPSPSNETEVGFVSGFFEEEYEDADSSLRQLLPRRRVGGAGVSVRRIGNSNKYPTLRLIQANMELVAYTTTDDNGEYEMPNLPEGEYAIRFEYPGVATDETSDVFFTIENNVSEQIKVDAKVEDGKIVITNNTVVLSNDELEEHSISLFPNPAYDYLNIGLSYLEGDIELKLIDLKGRVVRESIISSKDTRVFIGDLEQGLYLVNLNDNRNFNINLKIIKK